MRKNVCKVCISLWGKLFLGTREGSKERGSIIGPDGIEVDRKGRPVPTKMVKAPRPPPPWKVVKNTGKRSKRY